MRTRAGVVNVEDVCDDVVVINHGRVVVAGDLDELRAAVPQRFVTIRYRGAEPNWSSVGAMSVIATKPGEVRLRVDGDTDLEVVVAAVARQVSQIVSFAYEPPTLSELFAQAVAA